MIPSDAVGLFAGAIALGAVHGVEPGHGWPVAASYALEQSNKWLYGFAASFIIGVGHLVSSIAMVVAFFFAKSYFELTQVNEPIAIDALGVQIGGPVDLVAGVLLILLGIREYTHGHSHSHGGLDDDDSHSHDHSHEDGHDHSGDDHDHSHHDDHGHSHAHDHSDHGEERGLLARLKLAIPFVGGHAHGSAEDAADRGLWGIAGFAFVLGFAHEEEFEIIALCAGSDHCLSLMSAYAFTVIVGIVTLTLLLIAGYEHYEDRVERYTDYLPAFSAAVLGLMGVGFVLGLL
jgi:hypothetical protein